MKLLHDEVSEVQNTAGATAAAGTAALPTSPAPPEAAIAKPTPPGTVQVAQTPPPSSTPTSAQQKRKAMFEKNQGRNSQGGGLTTHLPRRKRARTEEVRLIKLEDAEIPIILKNVEPPQIVCEQLPSCGICQAIIPSPGLDQKVCDICRKQNEVQKADTCLTTAKVELQLKLSRLGDNFSVNQSGDPGGALMLEDTSTHVPMEVGELGATPHQEVDDDQREATGNTLSAAHLPLENGNYEMKAGEEPQIKIEEEPQIKIEEKPQIKIEEKPQIKIEEKPQIKIEVKPQIKIEEKPQIKIEEVDEEDDGSEASEIKEESITSESRASSRRPHPLDRVSRKEQLDVATGAIEVPGIVPSLMDLSDSLKCPKKDNYLKAGLLSSYFKSIGPPPPINPDLSKDELLLAIGVPVTKKIICPLVAKTGGRIPAMPVDDYRLPYDLFCFGVIRTKNNFDEWIKTEEERRTEERKNKKLKQPKTPKPRPSLTVKAKSTPTTPDSWTFKRLRYNNYLGGGYNKPQASNGEDNRCDCEETELKCSTDDCLNRVVFTECPPSCGENCKNRRIQKHEWVAELKQFLTADKGYGVKSTVPLKKASIILEYVGEVVTAAEFKRRMSEIYVNDTHHYCLQLDSGLVIDGHRSGGKGRFVNHSCDPNCEMQKWLVNGIPRMALFTLRDIPADEELSYDYNFSLYNENKGQACHCKSENCRGVIGGKSKVNGKNSKDKNPRKVELVKGVPYNSWTYFKSNWSGWATIKHLFRKETTVVRNGHVFLLRNYEMGRKLKDSGTHSGDTKVRERVEKLMAAWVHRFKVGSAKSKSLVLIGEDPKVSALARMAQIFFEFYFQLTSAKGTNDKPICEPFMEFPSKTAFPMFHSVIEKTKFQGLKSIETNILQGRYESINALEEDLRVVFTTFAFAFETENAEVGKSLTQIKDIYKEAKTKALQALDPFITLPPTPPSNSTSPVITLNQSVGSHSTISLPPFLNNICNPEEETILRCICGTFAEEGMMIQCDNCLVWQHCDCMRVPYDRTASESVFNNSGVSSASPTRGRGRPRKLKETSEQPPGAAALTEVKMEVDEDFSELSTQVLAPTGVKQEVFESGGEAIVKEEPYSCEKCDPRDVNPEVPMGGSNDTPEQTFYLTLLREDGFLLRKDDTVYVLRDWRAGQHLLPDGTPRPRLTYLTAGPLVTEDCDILRIDNLWIDDKGNRKVTGYNYFRPVETYHGPNRRFYPNEVLWAPVPEIIDIEFIHGRCWVMDTSTFCIGRPIGSIEEHVYICDFRVDKNGRLMAEKIVKKVGGISTKPYAFNEFQARITIRRNVYPHGVPTPDFNLKPTSLQTKGNEKSRKSIASGSGENKQKGKGTVTEYEKMQIAKKRMLQRDYLNTIADSLGKKIEDFDKEPVNLSGLLERTKMMRRSKSFKFQ